MSQENKPAIPKVVEKEIESYRSEQDLLGGYIQGQSGGDSEKLPLVENWFPSKEEWHGKSVVSPRQARAMAIAKHLPDAFDEIEIYQDFINSVIDDYLKLLTSVEGVSREQQKDVLMALFGGFDEDQNDAKNWMKAAISSREGENDE